jgi:biotin carboxyl carrier protein
MEFVVKSHTGKKATITVEEMEEGRLFAIERDGQRRVVDYVQQAPGVFSLLIDGVSYEAFLSRVGDDFRLVVEGEYYHMGVRETEGPEDTAEDGPTGPVEIRSVIPGRIVSCLVREGDVVHPGQGLVVVEAMKMENEMKAPVGGRIAVVAVTAGQTVEANTLLARIEPEEGK